MLVWLCNLLKYFRGNFDNGIIVLINGSGDDYIRLWWSSAWIDSLRICVVINDDFLRVVNTQV